jgi:hypothetical protein
MVASWLVALYFCKDARANAPLGLGVGCWELGVEFSRRICSEVLCHCKELEYL